MNQGDFFAELLVAVDAGEPQQVADLLVLVPQRVRPELFGAEVAAEVLLALERVPLHVVLTESVLPLEGEVLVEAVDVGAEEPSALLAHRVVSLGHVVHGLNFKSNQIESCKLWQVFWEMFQKDINQPS